MRAVEFVNLNGYISDALCGADCLRADAIGFSTRRNPLSRRGCSLKIDRFDGVKDVLIAGARGFLHRDFDHAHAPVIQPDSRKQPVDRGNTSRSGAIRLAPSQLRLGKQMVQVGHRAGMQRQRRRFLNRLAAQYLPQGSAADDGRDPAFGVG